MGIRDFVEDYGRPKNFEPGEFVFQQGDKNGSLYFVKKGLLKAFYTTRDGKDFIKSFILEGDVIGSLTALKFGSGCTFSLECLERSQLICFEFVDLIGTLDHDLEVARDVIDLLTGLAMKKERREYEFLCLSAEERYESIRKRTPNLLDRVTQNDIARYLGITPVALSRIRSKSKLSKSSKCGS